jgi:hypothetical protein
MHPLDQALQYSLHGEFDKAYAILQSLPTDDLRAQYNLGFYKIRNGDLLGGFESLNVGRWIRVFGSPPASTKPIWKDQPLHDRPLLFHSEGGLGDHIINVRFAKYFHDMGAKVIVSTDRSMFPVFRQLEFIHQLVDVNGAAYVDHDYWVPGMAAAYVLGMTSIDPTPYIPRLHQQPHTKFRIGLRWSGSPEFEHEQHRRFDPTPLFQLAEINNAEVYSFQRDENTECLPSTITDLQHELHDWYDTQWWLSQMDVVVTSCTSVAHMSAAMGIDTRIIIPCLPYYIWANNSIRWYSNATLYQQKIFGDWTYPLNQVVSDVARLSENFSHVYMSSDEAVESHENKILQLS